MQGTAFTKAQMQGTAHCVAQECRSTEKEGNLQGKRRRVGSSGPSDHRGFFSQCPGTWGLTCTPMNLSEFQSPQ